MTTKEEKQYMHGHHASVLNMHNNRTVKSSAPHLIKYIKPDMKILDIGCGPGSITLDLAANYVPEGSIVGIEPTEDPLEKCRELAKKMSIDNAEFRTGDILKLPFADNTFDIVHIHQVMQYIANTSKAFEEMRRVTKHGGIVSVRECDYGSVCCYPDSAGTTKWLDLYMKVAKSNNSDACIGRKIKSLALKAGYEADKLELTASNWCFQTDEEVQWWGGTWAQRVLQSNYATVAVDYGHATRADLEEISEAWSQWSKQPDAWFNITHAELLYHKS